MFDIMGGFTVTFKALLINKRNVIRNGGFVKQFSTWDYFDEPTFEYSSTNLLNREWS